MIEKYKARLNGIKKHAISLYKRGLTTKEISDHIREMYNYNVSASLVSLMTEDLLKVIDDHLNAPLEDLYLVVYIDCIMINIKEDGVIKKQAVYVVIGINEQGQKKNLGIWIHNNEGAKSWANVLLNIKNRGVKNICIICCDGLKGLPKGYK